MAMKKKNTAASAKGANAARAAAPKDAPAKTAPAAKADGTAPRLSLVAAAVAVLGETDEALNTKRMIELARERGLWTPGAGKTPEQTLYSAIAREIKARGENARFVQVSKGRFRLRPAD